MGSKTSFLRRLTTADFGLGLGGESLRQIENLLGNERINNAEIGNTLDAIFTEENEYELDHANRMYVDRAVLLRKPYKRELSK